MEINIGQIIVEDEICIGEIEFDITKEYLGLESLTVIPGADEKFFKPEKYAFGDVTVKGVKIIDDYLNDDRYLELTLEDGSIIKVDLNHYFDDWTKIVAALNAMIVDIETGDLVMTFDDVILNLVFSIKDGDLILENNMLHIDFYMNDKNELEVRY